MNRFLLVALTALTLSACDSNDPEGPAPVDLSVRTATEVAADPAQRNPDGSPGTSTGRYTLYSLRENRVVLNYDNPVRTDSASTRWDIGFRGTDLIVNGGASGPGSGAAVVLSAAFSDVASVPAGTTFRVDGTDTCANGRSRAICEGSAPANTLGFYTYTPFASGGGYITPTAGRTILVRTADGTGYAKVQVRSYYQGSPEPSAIVPGSVGRYYTFSYVLNPEGTSFVAAL